MSLAEPPFLPLSWDSENFGFPVARLYENLGNDDLLQALLQARNAGFRLVYWASVHARRVPPDILLNFAGRLVDHKTSFGLRLGVIQASKLSQGTIVAEYPKGPASSRMVELAIASGQYSRFFMDPWFPRDKFHLLYEAWIQRSTSREAADNVLAVYTRDDNEPAGMITLSVEDGVGRIGLIAVLPKHRNRGLASALMGHGHQWMQTQGATHSTVVTQLDNDGACNLYRRFGYNTESVQDFYHFWPAANGTSFHRSGPE